MAKATRSSARKGRVNRGLKPRKRDDYDNEKFGRRDSSLPPDDYTINEKIGRVQVIRPRGKEGILVFRPWPSLDYERPNENLDPGRKGTEDREQGYWIRRMPVAAYIGMPDCEKATFILYRPGDKAGRANSPYWKLYRTATAAHDAGEFANGKAWNSKWNKLLKGKKGHGPALSKPTARWYVQGEVFRNGERDYLEDRELPLGADPDDDLVIVEMGDSAGEALMSLLAVRKDSFEGDETANPALPFFYGDPCGHYDEETCILSGGLFFTIWCPKNFRQFRPKTKHHSWDGKYGDFPTYECLVSRKYRHEGQVYTPDRNEAGTEQIFSKWQFWYPDIDDEEASEGLLHIPSVEEQCTLIARAFKAAPKLLMFAWADNWDEYGTEEVRAILADRAQGVVPGGEDEYQDGEPAEDEDEDEDEFAGESSGKKKGARRGKDVTAPDEEDEFAEGDDEEEGDEDAEEPEDEEGDEEFEEPEGEDEEFDEPEDEDEGGEDDEFEDSDEEEPEEEGGDEEPEGEDDYGFDEPEEDEDEGEGGDEFEEDSEDSAEFDPDEEASDKEAEMSKSMAKADAAGKKAASRSSQRTSKATSPPKKKTSTKKSTKKAPAKKTTKKAPAKKTTASSAPKKKTSTKKSTKGTATKKKTSTKKSSK